MCLCIILHYGFKLQPFNMSRRSLLVLTVVFNCHINISPGGDSGFMIQMKAQYIITLQHSSLLVVVDLNH